MMSREDEVMICFLDRSFCSSDCVNHECHHNLTPELQARADKLDLPVAVVDYRTGCSGYIAPGDGAPSAPVAAATSNPER